MGNVIITLTPAELSDIIRAELEKYFEGKSRDEKPSPVDSLLTIKDAAVLVSLSVYTIYSLVSKSEIPHMKKGKRLYFSKDELTAWIKKGKRKTVDELRDGVDDYITRPKA